jgi:hypothetical protein
MLQALDENHHMATVLGAKELGLEAATHLLSLCLWLLHKQNWYVLEIVMGWDSIASIVTCYRLDSLGIESQWDQDFPRPPSLLYNGDQVSFLGIKQLGCDIKHPPTSFSQEVICVTFLADHPGVNI